MPLSQSKNCEKKKKIENALFYIGNSTHTNIA